MSLIDESKESSIHILFKSMEIYKCQKEQLKESKVGVSGKRKSGEWRGWDKVLPYFDT